MQTENIYNIQKVHYYDEMCWDLRPLHSMQCGENATLAVSTIWNFPAGSRCNNNVFIMSKRRHRRRFDVMKTLSLRHYCVMCPLGCHATGGHLSREMSFYLYRDFHIKIRWSHGRHKLTMEIPTHGKPVFISKRGPDGQLIKLYIRPGN